MYQHEYRTGGSGPVYGLAPERGLGGRYVGGGGGNSSPPAGGGLAAVGAVPSGGAGIGGRSNLIPPARDRGVGGGVVGMPGAVSGPIPAGAGIVGRDRAGLGLGGGGGGGGASSGSGGVRSGSGGGGSGGLHHYVASPARAAGPAAGGGGSRGDRLPVGQALPPPPPYPGERGFSPHSPAGGGVSRGGGGGAAKPHYPPPAYGAVSAGPLRHGGGGGGGGGGGAVAQGLVVGGGAPVYYQYPQGIYHHQHQFVPPPPPGPPPLLRLPYGCARVMRGSVLTPEEIRVLDKLPRLEGTRHTYEAHSDTWVRTPAKVVIEAEPFAEGAMRQCHRVYEVDGSHYILSVAKIFKTAEMKSAYFDEALTQMVAESYAQEYNKLNVPHKVAFLSVSVLTIPSVNAVMALEPMLAGEYVKHNDNAGHIGTDEITPQAFSHYTLQASGGQLLVCDIQGVGDFFTDPQIHAETRRVNFGLGNLRGDGIKKFRETHVCNEVCRRLELTPCNDTADAQLARKLQEMEFAAAGRPMPAQHRR